MPTTTWLVLAQYLPQKWPVSVSVCLFTGEEYYDSGRVISKETKKNDLSAAINININIIIS